jgi:membrane protein
MTPPPNSALNWEGRTVIDRSGEKVGTIEEVLLVEETGEPEWALVKMGRLKSRTTLVPLTRASAVADGVKVAYGKDVIGDAPPISTGGDPSLQEVERVYRHYGLDPGDGDGGGSGATATTGQAAPAPRQAPAAQRQQAPAPRLHRDPPSRSSDSGPRGGGSARGGQQASGGTLKRTVKEFSDDNLTHWAAALTYYGVLSIFPALLALVSILGLVGSSAIQPLIDNLSTVAPGPAKEILTGALTGLQQGGGAGLLFIVSLAGAIWAASGYISAFMDASNAVYDMEEGRSLFKRLPLRIGITVLMLVLLAVSAIAVVVSGPVAEQAGKLFGVGDSAVTLWNIAKWPVLVLIVAFMFAVLYYTAPNVKQPGLKSVLPGGVLAVVLWIVVSAAFAFYVANFGSYNKTYGALGGVIVFLVWLWLTNLAILLGAEFNAERARERHIESGHSPDDEPYLAPRSQP